MSSYTHQVNASHMKSSWELFNLYPSELPSSQMSKMHTVRTHGTVLSISMEWLMCIKLIMVVGLFNLLNILNLELLSCKTKASQFKRLQSTNMPTTISTHPIRIQEILKGPTGMLKHKKQMNMKILLVQSLQGQGKFLIGKKELLLILQSFHWELPT